MVLSIVSTKNPILRWSYVTVRFATRLINLLRGVLWLDTEFPFGEGYRFSERNEVCRIHFDLIVFTLALVLCSLIRWAE